MNPEEDGESNKLTASTSSQTSKYVCVYFLN